MTRFAPDSTLISSYAHTVYRYKTGEIDDDGEFVYRPMSFQNDLEDITLTYGNFDILEFDPSVPEQASEAFRNKVTDLDENIAQDIQNGKLDLFQFMEHIANFIHVGSKTFAPFSSLPTKLSQLQNDAGYVKTTDTVERANVADTADALTNEVQIKLSGHASGSTNFKGNQNVTISVSGVKATSDVDGNAIKTTYAKKDELPLTMTAEDLDASDETAKIISAQTLKTFVSNSIDSSNTGVRSVVTGTSNGTIRVNTGGTTTNVPVKGLGTAAYTSSDTYAPKTHYHASSDVTSMNGYSIASSYTAIKTTDSLNAAIGKLEKHFDDKQNKTDTIENAEKATKDASGNVITTTYATKAEVSAIPKFKIEVVSALPATGDTATVYLVQEPSSSGNMYTEYIYVNSNWELLGGQNVDLTGYLKSNQITTGLNNGAISVDGTDISVKGLGTAAYKDDTYFSESEHTHASNEITKMTGYVKQNSYTAITANDSLNVAIGKLEKRFDSGGTADDANSLGGYPASDYVRAVQITSGTENGKISVQGNGVSVYGLKSAAYKDTDYFSISTHSHDVMVGASSSAAGEIGFVPKPAKGDQAKFLRADATWQPANNYEHPTTAGNKHIPAGGATNNVLIYGGSSGTAAWSDWCIWVTND